MAVEPTVETTLWGFLLRSGDWNIQFHIWPRVPVFARSIFVVQLRDLVGTVFDIFKIDALSDPHVNRYRWRNSWIPRPTPFSFFSVILICLNTKYKTTSRVTSSIIHILWQSVKTLTSQLIFICRLSTNYALHLYSWLTGWDSQPCDMMVSPRVKVNVFWSILIFHTLTKLQSTYHSLGRQRFVVY